LQDEVLGQFPPGAVVRMEDVVSAAKLILEPKRVYVAYVGATCPEDKFVIDTLISKYSTRTLNG
jgi:hypothetical protein